MTIADIESSDPVSIFRSKINEILDVVNIAAKDMSGTLAGRPAAGSVDEGTYYFATDTAVLYRSDASNWHEIGFTSDRVRLERNADLAFGGASQLVVPWDTEVADVSSMYDSGSSTRLTIQRPGVYSVAATFVVSGSPTALRGGINAKDSGGASKYGSHYNRSANESNVQVSGLTGPMVAGDFIDIDVVRTGGTSPELTYATVQAVRISP